MLPGVQSFTGGAARISGVFSEGELSKSNRSSSVLENSSRLVRCNGCAPLFKKRFSINASKEVWLPTVCET